MKPLVRVFTILYLVTVVVFAVADITDSSYRPDLPVSNELAKRVAVSVGYSAIMSSQRLRESWSELRRDSARAGRKSIFTTATSLVLIYFSGFAVICLLLVPVYLYAWASDQPRGKAPRPFNLHWKNPRFRDAVQVITICLIVLSVLVFVANYPLVAGPFFVLGCLSAFRQPLLVTVPFGLLDRYGISAPNKLREVFKLTRITPNNGQAAKSGSSPSPAGDADAKPSQAATGSSKSRSPAWQKKINRKPR